MCEERKNCRVWWRWHYILLMVSANATSPLDWLWGRLKQKCVSSCCKDMRHSYHRIFSRKLIFMQIHCYALFSENPRYSDSIEKVCNLIERSIKRNPELKNTYEMFCKMNEHLIAREIKPFGETLRKFPQNIDQDHNWRRAVWVIRFFKNNLSYFKTNLYMM